jgi:peptidyl-prolyl cis-trans isomerase D
MITFFRRLINSRIGAMIALGFVILIGIGFALGDVTRRLSGGNVSEGNIAKVGSANIPMSEFTQALNNQLDVARRDTPTLDMGRFVSSGALDSTLDLLIKRYALAIFGEENGAAVSKRLVDFEILKIPQAKGPDGKPSPEAFRAFLQNLKLTESMVRTDFTQNLFRQQILPVTVSGTQAPESMVLPYASLDLEKRTGVLAAIPSAAFLPKNPPTDAELTKYYAANTTRFTLPEKRAISYAIYDRKIIGDRAKPSDAEVAAYYKANAAKYSASQSRDISQIILPTEAGAKAVAAKIAGGTSFADAAKEVGLSVASIKTATREALTSSGSKAVADAVFAGTQGTVIAPTKGGLGWFLIRVDAVQQVAARPLAVVSADITKQLAQEKADTVLSELNSEIENEFAGGATIADIAKAQGLKVETTPKIFATGANPADPAYRPIAEMKGILPPAFQMEHDGDAQLIELIPGQMFAMISIADFEEAAPPPMATVKDVVIQQWALAQGNKAATIAAETVRKAIMAGKTMPEALASLGVKLPATQTVSGSRAELNKDGKPLAPPLVLLFSMKQGTAKTLQAPNNGGWFVVQATQIIKGDARGNTELLSSRRLALTEILKQEYAEEFILAAMKDVGVTKNDRAITDLRNRLTKKDGQ